MTSEKKAYRGIGLYPEDWTRIKRLLQPREKVIDFIEEALTHEFERREEQIRRPMATL